MPRYSILLPTHNRADVLRYAIKSVLWQSEQDYELLIVGDGCTDHTAEVVGQFDDPRIRWFDLPKAPHFGFANRNIVLKQARGAYVAFMAHDDIILPDHLELMASVFDNPDVEWAYSRPIWVNPNGTIMPFMTNLYNPHDLNFFLTVGNTIPATCVVYRYSCHEKYGFWPEDVTAGSDWRLWINMIRGGNQENFDYVPEPTTFHFRADWRTDDNAGPQQLKAGWTLASEGTPWPRYLQMPTPEDKSLQQVLFEMIEPNPTEWTKHFRRDTIQFVDQLAWTVLSKYIPERDRHQQQITHLNQKIQQLEQHNSQLIAHQQALTDKQQQIEDWNVLIAQLQQELDRERNRVLRLTFLRKRVAPPGSARERLWLSLRRVIKGY